MDAPPASLPPSPPQLLALPAAPTPPKPKAAAHRWPKAPRGASGPGSATGGGAGRGSHGCWALLRAIGREGEME